ncbi:MAG: protein kinase [Planctomycetes bacterium]|nr:protein kinase [Planctomycetota bacterium]
MVPPNDDAPHASDPQIRRGDIDLREKKLRDASDLGELVVQCLARMEVEGPRGIQAFCLEHPEQESAIRRRIEHLRRLGFLNEQNPVAPVEIPKQLGDFAILEKLGEGGMGVVYLAEQVSLKRMVALKFVRPWHLGFTGARERFKREVEAVARLQHPGIVPIYAVGEDGGVPYFAMERVIGCSLGEALRDLEGRNVTDLTGRDLAGAIAKRAGHAADVSTGYMFEGSWTEVCLRIVQQVADALEHAHRRGVIHRDVKPGNLMITPAGRVMLVDFGLASTGGDERITHSGARLGSLPYFASEQVRGKTAELDARTDVYGLGVTLFELLTHRMPYVGETPEQTMRLIEVGHMPRIRDINETVSWEAETVCAKAMECERGRRYVTAADFGRDIENVLQHRPIEAKRPSAFIRFQKWTRRNPASAVGIILGSLLVVGLPSVIAYEESTRTEIALTTLKREKELRRHADGLRLTATALSAISTDPGLAIGLAIEAAQRSPGILSNNALVQALHACREVRTLSEHAGRVNSIQFGPDGKLFLTASNDETARIWNSEDGHPIATLVGHEGPVVSAVFSQDGTTVLTASADGTARIWNVTTAANILTIRAQPEGLNGACFDASASRILTFSQRGPLELWDAKSGALLKSMSPGPNLTYDASLSADGETVLSHSTESLVRLWDATAGTVRAVLKGYTKSIRYARFSPDGTRVVAGGDDNNSNIWNVKNPEERVTLLGHADVVTSGRFNTDGTLVATGSYDHTVRIWDARTGAEKYQLRGHTRIIRDAVFSPDGRQIATCSDDQSARLWEPNTGRVIAIIRGQDDSIFRVALSAGEPRVATLTTDVKLWRAASTRELEPWLGHTQKIEKMQWNEDGTRFTSASRDNTARLWDTASGHLIKTYIGSSQWIHTAALSRDDAWIATGGMDKKLRLYRTDSEQPEAVMEGHAAPINQIGFSPDGGRIVSSGADGISRIWDRNTHLEIMRLVGHTSVVDYCEFSPDGKQVVTAARNGVIYIWDSATGEIVHSLEGHTDHVSTVRFSHDGTKVVSANWDRTARVFDCNTGETIATLIGHRDWAVDAVFSDDDQRIITCSTEGTARLWDARTGEELVRYELPDTIIKMAYYNRASSTISTITQSGDVDVWPIDPMAAALRRAPRALTIDERIHYEVGAPETLTSARQLLDISIKQCATTEEARERIQNDSGISPEVRDAALLLLSTNVDFPSELARQAWETILSRDATREQLELARRRAAKSGELRPGVDYYNGILGAALFRLGKYTDALESLKRANLNDPAAPSRRRAMGLPFLALTLHALARTDEARAEFAKFRELYKSSPVSQSLIKAAFVEEVEKTIAAEPAR